MWMRAKPKELLLLSGLALRLLVEVAAERPSCYQDVQGRGLATPGTAGTT